VTPRLPAPVRALNGLGRALPLGRLPFASLDPDELERAAAARAGAERDAPPLFREGLRMLARALDDEAELTLLGRLTARRRIVTLLENRARLEDDLARRPGVAAERIERPLVVVGLPRTGTTFLHTLLAQDPSMRSPLFWEVREPSPAPAGDGVRDDPRIAACAAELEGLYRLLPAFRAVHPMQALWPQECVAITAHTFVSMQHSTTWRVPGYAAWLDRQDHGPAYAFHRRFLQHLQHGRPRRRFVLKTPAHLWTLGELFAAYPDAGVIHTHRDPVRVLASLCSLESLLRKIASDAIDPAELGREWAPRLAEGLARATAFRAATPERERQFADVHYAELLADPLGVVARIYAQFELPFTAEARERMAAFVRDQPADKHGVHRYRLADFALDEATERDRVAAYVARFAVPAEPA
jgi:hypothetical protein